MVEVVIPFKAKIEFRNNTVSVRGSQSLLQKISDLRASHGADPRKWPQQKVESGEDILINEFIQKMNGTFKFCYNHEELCHCRNVPTEKVFSAIKGNCFRVEDVSRTTLAGTGCGSCRKDISDLIEQFKTS
jgi:bacterioferritin-associated ferredoxin